jgi:A/G-specific adenine glycosylase
MQLDDTETIQKIDIIRTALISWGEESRRDFPWRHTQNPYNILIAEVLLHRTRADQVRPIFERLVKDYPDIPALLDADPADLNELLSSLGLQWRIDLLLKMVDIIGSRHGGEIPLNREELMALPGVGDYIASALLTFTGTSAEPIMDTNTVRVIGRVFGLKLGDSARRRKEFREIMKALIQEGNAADISFSLIDLAALICRPRQPLCEQCPINTVCVYHENRTRSE